MRQVVKCLTKADSPIPLMCFGVELDDREKREQIARRAYFKSEARGYRPGHELEDWLEAEAEILSECEEAGRK